MEEEAKIVLGEILKLVKTKAELSPKPSSREEKIKREALKQIKKERAAVVVSSRQSKIKFFDLMPGKHINIYSSELSRHQITLGKGDFEKSLGKLVENRILKDFIFVYSDNPRQEDCYKLILPDDFEEVAGKFEEEFLDFNSSESMTAKLVSDITVEYRAGKLTICSDGTIRYKGKILELEPRLKEICRMFLEKPNQLIGIDEIRDRIIKADKRSSVKWETISKYVSKLHNSLKIHFKKNVIFNNKEEGWYFNP